MLHPRYSNGLLTRFAARTEMQDVETVQALATEWQGNKTGFFALRRRINWITNG
ncbi:MAG: hypothetical protein ACRBBQ_03035 [Cognatishimia sp.]